MMNMNGSKLNHLRSYVAKNITQKNLKSTGEYLNTPVQQFMRHGHTSTRGAHVAGMTSTAFMNHCKQQKRYGSSSANLPDTEPVIYHDELITTDNILKQIDQLLVDEKLSNYESKYNMTFEEFEQEFNEQVSKTSFYDEEYIDFIANSLDFPRQEVEEIVNCKTPNFYQASEDGNLEVDWEEFSRLFQRTETEKAIVPEIERKFKDMKQFVSELEQEDRKEMHIDWDKWRQTLGSNTISKIQSDLNKVIEKTSPEIDFKRIEERLDMRMQPFFDQVKDDLVESLPQIKEMTSHLSREIPLMRKDQNGLYPFYLSPGFLDQYFPNERDEIIQEIEDDEWDVEYTQQYKATKLSPDEILLRNKNWMINESSQYEDEDYRDITSAGAATSEKDREEQDLYHGVVDGSRLSKELENEVNQLRLTAESEEGAKGEEKKSEKEEKHFLAEDEWWAFLKENYGITPDMKQQRDFAHFETEEQLKQWEETGERERIEAEEAFFNTERLSSS